MRSHVGVTLHTGHANLPFTMADDKRRTYRETLELNLRMLEAMRMADMADMVDASGALKPMSDWPVDVRAMITSYRVRPDGSPEVRFEKRLSVMAEIRATVLQLEDRGTGAGGVVPEHVTVRFYNTDLNAITDVPDTET